MCGGWRAGGTDRITGITEYFDPRLDGMTGQEGCLSPFSVITDYCRLRNLPKIKLYLAHDSERWEVQSRSSGCI